MPPVTDAARRWPTTVYADGAEPDPRFSLANERTFLAWIRTSLAMLAGAAAVHAIDLAVSDLLQRSASALLALSGLVCAVHAWRGWARTERAMRRGQPLPSNAPGILVVVAVAAVAILMIVVGSHG